MTCIYYVCYPSNSYSNPVREIPSIIISSSRMGNWGLMKFSYLTNVAWRRVVDREVQPSGTGFRALILTEALEGRTREGRPSPRTTLECKDRGKSKFISCGREGAKLQRTREAESMECCRKASLRQLFGSWSGGRSHRSF